MSEKQASPSAPSNNSENERVISLEDPEKGTTTSNVLPKKWGRVKGSKAELDALTSGGTGGRAKKAIFGGNKSNKETHWKLDEAKYCGRVMINESSASSYSTEESSDSEDSFFDTPVGDHEVEQCVSHLDGNRILPIKIS